MVKVNPAESMMLKSTAVVKVWALLWSAEELFIALMSPKITDLVTKKTM